MSFDAYKVAVKLTLINGVSGILGALTSQFSTFDKHVNNTKDSVTALEKRLQGIKTLGLVGGGMFAAGSFGLSLFKAPIEEAIKLDQQVNKFKLFGMGDKVNAEAVSFAKGMNIMGSSYTENMKLMIEAQGVFRESGISGSAALDGAKLAAPLLAKIAFATKSLDGESAAKLTSSAMSMLRYVEDSGGLKSPERFRELADAGWKMVQTSGGSVSWEQLRQFKARSGVAGMNLSGDAMAEMEPIITMLKGQTAGFSLRTAYNRLNGIIKIPNQVAHSLTDSGIWDASKVTWNSQGGIKGFKGNPLQNADMFSSNPIEFYEKFIMPLHAKQGITTDSGIAQSNAMLFGSTGGSMFTLIDKNLAKLHQSLDAQNKALGIDPSYKVAGDSATGKIVDLHAQWAKLMADLGTTILPIAISGITSLTNVVKGAISFTKEFPLLTKGLTVAFAALSGIVAVGGVLFLATAAFGALGVALTTGVAGGGLAAVIGGVSIGLAPLAAGIIAIGAALYTVKWLYDLANSDDKAKFIGTGNDWYQKHPGAIDTVKPSSNKPIQVNTEVKLDNKTIAQATTKYQTREALKPISGLGRLDPSMQMTPPNLNFGH